MIDLAPFVAAGMLTIESKTWLYQGLKEQQVRQVFDVTFVRYYQLLNGLLDTELALQLDPATANRLLRRRDQLKRSRRLAG